MVHAAVHPPKGRIHGNPAPPARLSKTQPSAGGLRRLPNVTIFATGHHVDMHGRAKDYGRDYLSQVVRNFADLKVSTDCHHEPPAVLGHEIVQARLKTLLDGDPAYQSLMADNGPTAGGGPSRTDEPAAGWLENLRLGDGGDTLVADIERIPPVVADMIDDGQLRFPSIEFKESATKPDGSPRGPFAYRLALLGGNPPAVKSIPPLGQSHFADAPPGVVIFADGVVRMADSALRDALIQRLVVDPPPLTAEFLGTLDDNQLSTFASAEAPAEDEIPADEVMADGELPADFDKTKCIADILAAEAPADPTMRQAELESLPDADLYALWQSVTGVTPMSDKTAVAPAKKPAVVPADVKSQVNAFADQAIARIDAHAAARAKEFDRKTAVFQKQQDAALAIQKARQDAEWSQAVSAFCDAEAVSGRISPAELDAADPLNLKVRLAAIPAADTICFADAAGTTVNKSRREAELEAIRKRPIRQFGDRIANVRPDNNPTRTAVKKFSDKYFARRKPRSVAVVRS